MRLLSAGSSLRRRRLGVVAAGAIALVVSLGWVAGGAGSVAQAKVASPNISSGKLDPAKTVAYWTQARMSAAVAVPDLAAASTVSMPSALKLTPDAPLIVGQGAPPVGSPQAATEPATDNGVAPMTECYHCTVPYTRYSVFPNSIYTTYPYLAVAKIFFTYDGVNYVCSGSTIYTNHVWTAGHCVANSTGTHHWASNVLVCPAYRSGVNGTYGCWAATNEWTTTTWMNYGSYEWDMGVIVTSSSGTKLRAPIGNKTGYFGYWFGGARDQDFVDLGYPAGSPFNGNTMIQCNSTYAYQESEGNNRSGPNSTAIGCDMTGGSSGGPWIVAFGSSNYLAGHNDWRWNAYPKIMNSPYLDSRACSLLNSAGRSCH